MLVLQGCSVYAGSVVENFDWGAGVPGREAFTSASPINGVRAQSGDAVFQENKKSGSSVFSGANGSGRGALLMKGQNNSVGFNYPVSAITIMKAEGKYYPGDTARGVRGFWIGCQSTAADNPLLNNQTTDRLMVQLNPSGIIIFRSVVSGVTNTAGKAEGSIQFSPGDLVKMELTVNMAEKTASVKVTGAGKDNVKVRTVKWTSDKIPDWGMIMINQTGNGQLLLDSVEVRTEPIILG